MPAPGGPAGPTGGRGRAGPGRGPGRSSAALVLVGGLGLVAYGALQLLALRHGYASSLPEAQSLAALHRHEASASRHRNRHRQNGGPVPAGPGGLRQPPGVDGDGNGNGNGHGNGNGNGGGPGGHHHGELRLRAPRGGGGGRSNGGPPPPDVGELTLRVGEGRWAGDRRRHGEGGGAGQGAGGDARQDWEETWGGGGTDGGTDGDGTDLGEDPPRASPGPAGLGRTSSSYRAMEIDAAVHRSETLADLVRRMMPANLRYATDVAADPDPDRTDVPIFWRMPGSGSGLIERIAGDGCLGIGTATDLARAGRGWGLRAEDGVVLTSDVWTAIDVLDGEHRGRLFALFVHPAERALAAEEEDGGRPGGGQDDWMVRHLAGVPRGTSPNVNDLAVAKEILRLKFVVGMVTHLDVSLGRFEAYFGWEIPRGHGAECRRRAIDDELAASAAAKKKRKKRGAAAPTEGSPGWRALEKRNELDMKLYRYAIHLYGEQKAMFD